MIYIFDTNSICAMSNYYPSAFAGFWAGMNSVVGDGSWMSVREVLNELDIRERAPFVQEWAEENRAAFASPTDAEGEAVAEILAVPHFQTVIGDRALKQGTPVADPFIVASARVNSGAVITEESYKRNAAKIPNICEHFEVQCHNLEWFIEQQGWTF